MAKSQSLLIAGFVAITAVLIIYLRDSGIDFSAYLQGHALWGVLIMLFSLSVGLGMAWSVLTTCTPEDKNAPPKRPNEGHGGEKFHHSISPISSEYFDLMSQVSESVGLIEIKNGQKTVGYGTGFVVGDGYLMTAYHVLKDKIDDVLDEIAYSMPEGDQYISWLRTSLPDADPKLERLEAVKQYLDKSAAKHVQKLTDSFKNSIDEKTHAWMMEKLKEKWCTQCIVMFSKRDDSGKKGSRYPFSFEIDIPFADRRNDVIILKIKKKSNREWFPANLRLDDGTPNSKAVIVGYLKDKENKPCKFIDLNCQVYQCNEKDGKQLKEDIKNSVDWWKAKENELKDFQKYPDPIKFEEEYAECAPEHNRKYGCSVLHAAESFVHGTSGSPIINIGVIDSKNVPLVTVMYQRGYPSFYYDVQRQRLSKDRAHFETFKSLVESNEKENERNEVISLKYFFEAGITMKRLSELLDQRNNEQSIRMLRQNIFGKIGNPAGIDFLDAGHNPSIGGTYFTDQWASSTFADQWMPSTYTGSLNDKTLRFLAKKLPSEWRAVMTYIELPQEEIDICAKNYASDVVECAFHCFVKWRNRNSHRFDFEMERDLISALDLEGRKDIIEELAKTFNITGTPEDTTKHIEPVEEIGGQQPSSRIKRHPSGVNLDIKAGGDINIGDIGTKYYTYK